MKHFAEDKKDWTIIILKAVPVAMGATSVAPSLLWWKCLYMCGIIKMKNLNLLSSLEREMTIEFRSIV